MLIPRVCAGFSSCSASNKPALLIAVVAFASADLVSYGAARPFQKVCSSWSVFTAGETESFMELLPPHGPQDPESLLARTALDQASSPSGGNKCPVPDGTVLLLGLRVLVHR